MMRQQLLALAAMVGGAAMICRTVLGESYDLPGLSNQVETARTDYEQALDALVRARCTEIEASRSSPAYLAARNAVSEAYQNYEEDRSRAMADLAANDPAYQQLVSEKRAVEAQLVLAREHSDTSVSRFNELYNQKSDIQKKMQAMEKQTLQKIGSCQSWQQWQEATWNLEALQSSLRAQVEKSTPVVKAQAQVDAVKVKLSHLDTELADARSADEAAARVQDHQNSASEFNNLIGSNGYGSNPFGYGYGYAPYYGYGGYGVIYTRGYRGGYVSAHRGTVGVSVRRR